MVSQQKHYRSILVKSVVFGILAISQTPCLAQPSPLPSQNSPINLTARFHIEKAKRTGFLIVKAVVPKGSHIYSLNQTAPLSPTRLALSEMSEMRATGKFKADKESQVIENDPIFETKVEQHSGTIQFYVPIEIASDVDPGRLKPVTIFSGQVCSDEGYCIPIQNQKVSAEFAGYFERQAQQPIPSQTNRR